MSDKRYKEKDHDKYRSIRTKALLIGIMKGNSIIKTSSRRRESFSWTNGYVAHRIIGVCLPPKRPQRRFNDLLIKWKQRY